MKKTSTKNSKSVTNKIAQTKVKSKPNFFLVSIHQLPIVIALMSVILAAAYIMTSVYIPKKEAETYWLDPIQPIGAPVGTPTPEEVKARLEQLKNSINKRPKSSFVPSQKPVPKETVDPTRF